jgi:hypothetical protein
MLMLMLMVLVLVRMLVLVLVLVLMMLMMLMMLVLVLVLVLVQLLRVIPPLHLIPRHTLQPTQPRPHRIQLNKPLQRRPERTILRRSQSHLMCIPIHTRIPSRRYRHRH